MIYIYTKTHRTTKSQDIEITTTDPGELPVDDVVVALLRSDWWTQSLMPVLLLGDEHVQIKIMS